MCYGCGFVTNSCNEKRILEFFELNKWNYLPELYKELMGEDENTGLIWMPNTINIPKIKVWYLLMVQIVVLIGAWAAVKATLLDKEGDKRNLKLKGTKTLNGKWIWILSNILLKTIIIEGY